jgi:hypothetical protein
MDKDEREDRIIIQRKGQEKSKRGGMLRGAVHGRGGSKGELWKRIRLYRESREGGHSERRGFSW